MAIKNRKSERTSEPIRPEVGYGSTAVVDFRRVSMKHLFLWSVPRHTALCMTFAVSLYVTIVCAEVSWVTFLAAVLFALVSVCGLFRAAGGTFPQRDRSSVATTVGGKLTYCREGLANWAVRCTTCCPCLTAFQRATAAFGLATLVHYVASRFGDHVAVALIGLGLFCGAPLIQAYSTLLPCTAATGGGKQ
jgi:hypothetical protein